MNILVAGGSGFIGARLVPRLVSLGHAVTVVDLAWFGGHVQKPARLVKRDIFDLSVSDLAPYDQVIFVAGVSNDPMADFSPAVNYIYNAACPAYLAYIAKKAGVKRFIYASSCSVYGNRGETLSVETDNAFSLYPYGISKLQGEQAVLMMQDDKFSVICLRQGTVCGYSPRMRFDLVLNTMYMKAMTEGVITVDNPEIWRPILAISDAVEGYVKAINAKAKVSGVFNLSSANLTVGEMGKIVQRYVREKKGKDVALVTNQVKNFRNYRVSTAKAKKILGARFEGTVLSILEEIDSHLPKRMNFSKDEYYNIRMFKKVIDTKKLLTN